MKRRLRVQTVLLATFAISLSAAAWGQNDVAYQPQGAVTDYFVGAWTLVSAEYKYPDGHTTPYPDIGPEAKGFLLYTASGRMCAQLMKPGRPSWADDRTPTATEAATALDGFVSYCGKFEIHEGKRTMVHLPETAWSPNWVGTTQERPYNLVNADRFFFRGDAKMKLNGAETPVVWTITWQRVK